MGRRVLRHIIDVGSFDRVRGEIGVHDVLKGGVIKGEGFTGFSVVQIRVCMTEFRQQLQVKIHLEMPGILIQLGRIQRT